MANGFKSTTSWMPLFLLCSWVCMWTSVECWSYFYSDTVMDWERARTWCRKHHTDMVAIQNQEEIAHLNSWLPMRKGYYWIGIRKINDVWTWVGTNKSLTKEATNWAKGEPNNGQKGKKTGNSEDCVEMYVKRQQEGGKWNDEWCRKNKTALCFSAACKSDSCLHGECVETINSHKCACYSGFYGERCEKVVQCRKEELTIPDKGYVNCTHPYEDFAYDSLCQYSCEEGYQPSPSRPLSCTSTGSWSEQPPTCTLVQCQQLSKPPKGSLKCSKPLGPFSYNSTCVITCDKGYLLDGSPSDTLRCESSGNWNGSEPSCVAVQCPALQNIENGFISCDGDTESPFSYGKSCSFSCAPGFRLKGPKTVSCTSAAEWSEQIPRCESITCQIPEGDPNLVSECSEALTELHPNSTCSFSCEPGFELQGLNTAKCSETGEWDEALPTCIAVQCPALQDIENGFISCDGDTESRFSYGKSCSFSCAPGFRLEGPSSVSCSSAAEWSEQIPRCESITCQIPEGDANLISECSEALTELHPNSTCSFSCEPGFELQGLNTAKCSETGEWNESLPTCIAVQCPALQNIKNGFISCDGDNESRFTYGKSCSFSCAPGFLLEGPSSISCSSAAEWSEQIPRCESITCQIPEGDANLVSECSKDLTELHPNSTCSFSCEPGFELQGLNTAKCSETGEWNESLPTCIAVQCPALQDIKNGFISCEGDNESRFSYGNTCSFSCAPGFRLEGPSSVSCTSAAEWNEQIPRCESITCQIPEGDANLVSKCSEALTELHPNSTCSFSCEPGFELQGLNTAKCSETGEWNEALPTCKIVRCKPLKDLENGNVTCSNSETIFNTQCYFTCNQDYLLDGHKLVNCDHTGSWSGKKPTCQAPPSSSTAITTGVTASATALASGLSMTMWILKRLRKKSSNFELISNSDIETPPEVYKNRSHGKTNITKRMINSLAREKVLPFEIGNKHKEENDLLNTGEMMSVDLRNLHHWVLTGALILFSRNPSSRGITQAWMYSYSLGPNQQWHEARQWCQKHFTDMVAIQNQEEAMFLNNLLPFNPQYYWIGVYKQDGEWTWVETNTNIPIDSQNWATGEPDDSVDQDCVEIYIKRAVDTVKWNNEKCEKQKGIICYSASCTQESCSFHGDCMETVGGYNCTCSPGFLGPRCAEVEQCPALDHTAFSSGSMNCSHPISTHGYSSTCEFRCNEGYKLIGQDRTICNHTGRWTSSVPTCSVIKCPTISSPVVGSMACVDAVEPFSFGSQCNFTCQRGYYTSEDNILTCLASGHWDKPTPTCTVVQCDSLEAPLHATIQCQDPHGKFSFGSTCSVRCDEGFDQIGTNVTTCSSRGIWSNALAVCQAKRCSSIIHLLHGSLFCYDPNGPFSFGSRCSKTCDEGFILHGTAGIECTSLGVWSADIPHCIAQRCPAVQSHHHGSMFCSDPHGEFSFASRCTVACEDGFFLNGTADFECTSAGKWNVDTPVCSAKTCPTLKSPPYGSIVCSGPYGEFSFGSHCTTTCKEGFVLNGPTEIECTAGSSWNPNIPQCLAKRCPTLSSPSHGVSVCSAPNGEFSYGAQCSSDCEKGFLLTGTAEIECTSAGSWSGEAPRCQAVQCEELYILSLQLSMTCSHPLGKFSFGSQCLFTCEDGYSLNGTALLLCSSTGLWSDTMPNCIGISMGTMWLLYTGYGAASAVAILCLIGLAFVIMMKFQKREKTAMPDDPKWGEEKNLTSEF
ncbi:sushi, von Willebrand factor type A, EGF and pentraxin domain-containing protein 1-like [Menidia menidia]